LFKDSNNNELFIINLATVATEGNQLPTVQGCILQGELLGCANNRKKLCATINKN